ncbi:DCN1-like protein 2 isoform 2-T2 [Urocitellus parryii]|uniref:DCN1-like protein 2 isoform X2 n=1 Tax=Urocitellus parryii TaxID=9999 RepID=UPI000E55CFE5|nr:DCN1-like protein 2 isoform X2 [Urocitellus parryii]
MSSIRSSAAPRAKLWTRASPHPFSWPPGERRDAGSDAEPETRPGGEGPPPPSPRAGNSSRAKEPGAASLRGGAWAVRPAPARRRALRELEFRGAVAPSSSSQWTRGLRAAGRWWPPKEERQNRSPRGGDAVPAGSWEEENAPGAARRRAPAQRAGGRPGGTRLRREPAVGQAGGACAEGGRGRDCTRLRQGPAGVPAGEHDPQDGDRIGIDGIQQFCDDLRLDPTSVSVLVIAWKFRAATQCEFSRKEFMDGMTELGCDTTEKLRTLLPSLEQELQDSVKFKDFYQFTFTFAKNPGQKGLGTSQKIDSPGHLEPSARFWKHDCR